MKYSNIDEFIACPKTSNGLIIQASEVMSCLMKDSIIAELMGDEKTRALLRVVNDAKGKPGNVLRVRRSGGDLGLGVTGCETLEGREVCPDDDMEDIMLGRARNATCVNKCGEWGLQSKGFQRSRQDATLALRNWIINMMTKSFFNQVGSFTGAYTYYSGLREQIAPQTRGFNSVTASTSHYRVVTTPATATQPLSSTLTNIVGKPEGEKAIAAKDKITMSVLKQLVPLMFSDGNICGTQKLNPYGIKYVLFLHPTQIADLKADPEWMRWICCADEKGAKNRLTTGAEGIMDGILIKSSEFVPYGVNPDGTPNTTVRRAILVGVDAAIFAMGGYGMNQLNEAPNNNSKASVIKEWNLPIKFVYNSRDYGDDTYLALSGIYGIKKTTFNNKDQSIMLISSYVPDTINK